MAADLHIHIFEGITEEDFATFNSNCMGSKFFDMDRQHQPGWTEANNRVTDTPNVWVGEVSWLKAGLFEDPDSFIPDTVNEIHELIGEDLPEITEELISKIDSMFYLDNKTSYHLASRVEVIDFLRQHIGKRCFTISW